MQPSLFPAKFLYQVNWFLNDPQTLRGENISPDTVYEQPEFAIFSRIQINKSITMPFAITTNNHNRVLEKYLWL